MKKFKEFLFFIIPLIVLTVLPIVLFVTNQGENAFIGNMQYLKLFLNDSTFAYAVFNTYRKPALFSTVAVLILVALKYFSILKFLKNRKIFYFLNIALASVVSFLVLLVDKMNFFGSSMGVYDPNYIITHSPPTVSISVFDIVLALQIGIFITFVFWLIELIINFIKNKKTVN